MGALLTAFKHYPDAAFLVVGCDYPLIDNKQLQSLIKASLQTNKTTSFYNILDLIYEPLISVYQEDIKEYLSKNLKLNKYSIKSILEQMNANIVIPEKQMHIKSIDTEEEYKMVMDQLYRQN